jgi:hypothetical protein
MKVRAAPGERQSPDGALPEFVPYVYRGTGRDELTPNMSGLGVRRNKGRRPKRPTGPCPRCGWGLSGPNHKIECG